MKQEDVHLPFSTVVLVFGTLSIPLAFAAHLCSLAVVLSLYAIGFGLWGQRRARRHLLRYSTKSTARARLGTRLGLVGGACGTLMWVLWASNVLLD